MLLVSTQTTIPIMELFELKPESTNSTKSRNIIKDNSSNNDVILCEHCKRSANNGIRCLGMCVADNEY